MYNYSRFKIQNILIISTVISLHDMSVKIPTLTKINF